MAAPPWCRSIQPGRSLPQGLAGFINIFLNEKPGDGKGIKKAARRLHS
jgi:hypothetical protein